MTNKPVIIITGVSSGIGLAAALLFEQKNWIVVGTVRRKDYPTELASAAVDVQLAEMTNPADIERVVRQAYKTYGRIDAVVANAGYAVLGPFESVLHAQWLNELAVNTVAVADLARAVLPHMRRRGEGRIVGVASVGGRIGLPGYSAYCASKFAVEGMLESLSHEVSDTDIKIRIIEPSTVKTPFWSRGVVRMAIKNKSTTNEVIARTITGGQDGGLSAERVAEMIYYAVTSKSNRLHYPVGITRLATWTKRILPDRLFRKLLHRFL